MAESSSDIVTVQTSDGEVEARRMGRCESGSSRWQVRYPWGTETFFGTSAEVAAHARRRVAETTAEPARHVQPSPVQGMAAGSRQ